MMEAVRASETSVYSNAKRLGREKTTIKQGVTDDSYIRQFDIYSCYVQNKEPGLLSQYSSWLQTGRPGDRGSIPGRGKRFLL
jgi:hypothetical protein